MYRVTFGLDHITVDDAESLKNALVYAARYNQVDPDRTIEVEELKSYACYGKVEQMFYDKVLASNLQEAEAIFKAALEKGSLEPYQYLVTKVEGEKEEVDKWYT